MPRSTSRESRGPRSGRQGGLPAVVRRAAAALGVAQEDVVAVGGATGATWSCGEHIMRLSWPEVLEREVLAMAAASTVVPVPRVVHRVDFDDEHGEARAAALLARLPGRPAGDLAGPSPEQAHHRGRVCGALHAALATVPPPAGLERKQPPASCQQSDPRAESAEPCLLHLDLHPFNVLVDAADEVTGVLDWANAAVGPPVLEQARTWSILAMDPASVARSREPRWAALVRGWAQAAGFEHLPMAVRVWAGRLMLDDLAGRYAADGLEHIQQFLRANGRATSQPGSQRP